MSCGVRLHGADTIQQLLNAGLLDESVTHLRYPVRKA
jgi:hypothetical protein